MQILKNLAGMAMKRASRGWHYVSEGDEETFLASLGMTNFGGFCGKMTHQGEMKRKEMES